MWVSLHLSTSFISISWLGGEISALLTPKYGFPKTVFHIKNKRNLPKTLLLLQGIYIPLYHLTLFSVQFHINLPVIHSFFYSIWLIPSFVIIFYDPRVLDFFLKPSLSTILPTHFSNILIHCISFEHSDSTPETNNSHIPLTDCSFQSFTCKVIETCKAFNLFCPPVTLTHKPVPGFISSLLIAHSMGRHHGHSLASTLNSLTHVSSPQPYLTIPNWVLV